MNRRLAPPPAQRSTGSLPHGTRSTSPAARRPLLGLAALLALALPAPAQTWVELTAGAAPGTPAELVLDQAASDAQDTYLDLTLHGYWTEDVLGPDQVTYQAIEVPGLGRIAQQGAPDLPAVRVHLALASGASITTLASAVPGGVIVQTGQVPYPWGVPAVDEAIDPGEAPGPGDADGSAAVFVKDAGVYGGTVPFPADAGTPVAIAQQVWGSILEAELTLTPVQWDPRTDELTIPATVRYHISHPGTTSVSPAMTRDRARLAAARFVNWPEVAGSFPTDNAGAARRWLAVGPAAWLAELGDLTLHRASFGYEVSTIATESTDGSCNGLRAAIQTWYLAGSPWADHYVLLVGDDADVPLCADPVSGLLGDQLYASPIDGDAREELFVGRLSVDDATDLRRQVDKIIGYELNPTPGGKYGEALLVAHQDGDYAAGQASVAADAAGYAVPPAITLIDGGAPGSSDAQVQSAINGGLGLVAYRGHGTAHAWADWNTSDEDFHKNEVLTLANGNTRPVVWSIGCNANAVQHQAAGSVDSLGETWLEVPFRGAVAHYGASAGTERLANDVLQAALFEGLYDRGIIAHGQLVAHAERVMDDAIPSDNGWAYLLLGDPAMRVRRAEPVPMTLNMPAVLELCQPGGAGDCTFTVTVTDGLGQPVADALVAAYKPSGPAGGPPDLFLNTYTDSSGQATVPLGPLEIGIIIVTTNDDGNAAEGTIGLNFEAWAEFGSSLEGVAGPPITNGDGDLAPGSTVTISLEQTAPQALAGVFLGVDLPADNPGVPFKCGTLKVFPSTLIQPFFMTSAQGDLEVEIPNWPALPPDTTLWFQWAIQDAAAECGVALSNAIRATQP